jgi:hypothetical protein
VNLGEHFAMVLTSYIYNLGNLQMGGDLIGLRGYGYQAKRKENN